MSEKQFGPCGCEMSGTDHWHQRNRVCIHLGANGGIASLNNEGGIAFFNESEAIKVNPWLNELEALRKLVKEVHTADGKWSLEAVENNEDFQDWWSQWRKEYKEVYPYE